MTMDALRLLEEIETLLSHLDGVTVILTQATDDALILELTIASPESRLLLTYCAEAANINFQFWARFSPGTPEAKSDPEHAIQYRYSCSKSIDQLINPAEKFKDLGAHLSWELYQLGAISAVEEKRYTELFNAVSRSQ